MCDLCPSEGESGIMVGKQTAFECQPQSQARGQAHLLV